MNGKRKNEGIKFTSLINKLLSKLKKKERNTLVTGQFFV